MTTKLKLTIKNKVIDSAKIYARQKGKGLSGLVENYLKSITTNLETKEVLSTKVTKLMVVIKLSKDLNHKKELGDILIEKDK